MEAVLLVIHLIVALGIIAVVLIQPSESGGFLGTGGNAANPAAPRRGADGLSRLTQILGACFFGTSLFLAILASRHHAPQSILDAAPAAEAEAAKPAAPEAPISK